MTELLLYYAPKTCALVPYIALSEAGADFQVHPINMRAAQNKTPAYLKINPQHKVPVLMIDGVPLTENVAIQLWIARRFPEADLLPANPWLEIQAVSLMSFCSSGLHPHLARINSPRKYCDVPGIEEATRRSAESILRENYQIVENLLEGREYFFDHFTAVDAYFFWCFRRAVEFELDVSAFPSCLSHYRRMQERQSVRKLLAFESEVQARFAAA